MQGNESIGQAGFHPGVDWHVSLAASGLLLYVRFCLLVLNIEDVVERAAFPDRIQRAGALAVQRRFLPPVSGESFLVTIALALWPAEGSCPRQSTLGRGKARLCHQSSSLPITDKTINLLLSVRGDLLTGRRGAQHLVTEKRNKEWCPGKGGRRPGGRAVCEPPCWRWENPIWRSRKWPPRVSLPGLVFRMPGFIP